MEVVTTGTTMVNPSAADEKKFRKMISLVDQINDLRAQVIKLAYDINDSDLKRNAIMLMGLPDEYARKL